MDTNVDPSSTLQVVHALIQANKDFDFLMVPGANHGPGGPYGIRKRNDFFVRHLLGVNPPDRNRTAAAAALDVSPGSTGRRGGSGRRRSAVPGIPGHPADSRTGSWPLESRGSTTG